jgi:RNA polymerase sigma factor (sigma-70 family)
MTATAIGAPVADLVTAAARGDEQAWSALIDRYSPLVMTVIHRFDLARADAADVNQTVWLRLVEHLDRLREPAAIPAWIVQTTRHECLRMLKAGRQTRLFDPLDGYLAAVAPASDDDLDEALLRAERHQALRDAYAELPSRCQELMALLLRDPPASYEEISEQLAIPVGSVGPTRGRCVHKLRNCPALAALTNAALTNRVRNADDRDADSAQTRERGARHDVAIVGR